MQCGRYDDLKTAQENMDLQSTILSRFDLIFIVKDERSADRDRQIARCDCLGVYMTSRTCRLSSIAEPQAAQPSIWTLLKADGCMWPQVQAAVCRHVLDVHRNAGLNVEVDEEEKRVRPNRT